MRVLFFGLALPAIAVALHVLFWKIRLPRRQTRAIVAIFLSTLIAGLIIARYAPPGYEVMGLHLRLGLMQCLQVALLFVSFMMAYVITYTAIEADSPSLVMVTAIAKAGPGGLEAAEFREVLNDDLLVRPRLRDLLRDRLAHMRDGKYALTPKGRALAGIFVFYRRLLGAPLRGG